MKSLSINAATFIASRASGEINIRIPRVYTHASLTVDEARQLIDWLARFVASHERKMAKKHD